VPAVGLGLLLLLPACAVRGLAFRIDDRVEIVAPDDRAEVSLPLTIEWTADELDGAGGGPFFAVFVDRSPIRPDQSLRALADDSCNRTPGCPDLAYLRDRGVYLTDERSVTLDVVPQRPSSSRAGESDRHQATIVVVDAEGRRIGEAAYTVEFTVEDR
jgi:hypothetical protein